MQHLGSYLKRYSLSNVQISFRTGISRSRLTTISKPKNDSITAEEFYLIALALDADIDKMAEYVFKDFQVIPPANNFEDGLTQYGRYLDQLLISQKDISNRTDMTEFRISTLRNNEKTVLLAKEVYLTAISAGRLPSEAFRFICGGLELNSQEEQDRLKAKYRQSIVDGKKADFS